MRKLLLSLTMAASLALGSCSSTGTIDPKVLAFLEQVQAGAAQACKIIPEISSLIGIWNAGVATTVAAGISTVCNLLPPAPASGALAASPKFLALPMAKLNPDGTVVTDSPPAYIGIVKNVTVNGWRTE